MSSIATEEDPTSICFRDSRWLDLFPLNKDTVLDYFCLSGFYDRTCNNELIKMQRLDQEKLLYLKGIEYVLIYSKEPDLYVIKKQRRESETIVFAQSIYYVIKGTVYQAPTLSAILASRTMKVVYYIQSALKQSQKEVIFNPYSGYSWKFKSLTEQSKVKKEYPVAENLQHTVRVDKLIAGLSSQVLNSTPSSTINSNSSFSPHMQPQHLKRKLTPDFSPTTPSITNVDKKQRLEQ